MYQNSFDLGSKINYVIKFEEKEIIGSQVNAMKSLFYGSKD